MTPKEALDKIRQLFADPSVAAPATEPAPAVMEAKEYVLEGGAKVLVSELEPGGMVSLVDDQGATSPAPAGEHKLVDGTVITVNEAGTITAVMMPEAPVMPEDELAKKLDEKMAAIREDVQKENDAIRQLIENLAKHDEFKATVEGINAKLQGLADAVTALLDTPSADPIQEPKDKFEKTEKKNERLQAVADMLTKLKSKA
jgi:hypothetical protein